MPLNRVDLGIQYFPQFAADRAIANAQIYIGQPNLDPAVLANQIQAYIVQENGTQVAVPQPIRTGAGGVPTYNGSPVQIGVNEAQYSLKVLSSTGSQIYYQPDNTDLAIVNAAQVTYNPAGTGAVATTVEDILDAQLMVDYVALRAYTGLAKTVRITGLLTTAQPQGIAGTFQYDPTDTTSADNNMTIIVDVLGRRWKRVYNGHAEIKWAGAIGDGVTHPLSEKFATLAEAQAIYPHATALTDEIDWAATQQAVNSTAFSQHLDMGPLQYVWNKTITMTGPIRPRGFLGQGWGGATSITWNGLNTEPIFLLDGSYTTFRDFRVFAIGGASQLFKSTYSGSGNGLWEFSFINAQGVNIFLETDGTQDFVQADMVFRRCLLNGLAVGYPQPTSFLKVNHNQGLNYFVEYPVINGLTGPAFHFVRGGCFRAEGVSIKDTPTLLRNDDAGTARDYYEIDGVFLDAGAPLQLIDARGGFISIKNFSDNDSTGVPTLPKVDITNSEAIVLLENMKFSSLHTAAVPFFSIGGKGIQQPARLTVDNASFSAPTKLEFTTAEILNRVNVNSYVKFRNSQTRGYQLRGFAKEYSTMHYNTADLPATGQVNLSLTPVSSDFYIPQNFVVKGIGFQAVGGAFADPDALSLIVQRQLGGVANLLTTTISAVNGRNQFIELTGAQTQALTFPAGNSFRVILNANSAIASTVGIRFVITLFGEFV